MFDGDDIAKMIFGGMKHGFGHGGFGGRGWGRRRHWGGGMGGLGWVIPAMVIGRIIEEATRQSSGGQATPPFPAPPQPGNPQSAPPPSPWTEPPATEAAAPAPKPRLECRYCGREVPAGATACLGCGAPQRM